MREFLSEYNKYIIMLKGNISDVCSHKYTKIKINSDDDLLLEETLNMKNVLILIKSFFNKNHYHHYHETFLEKCLYK